MAYVCGLHTPHVCNVYGTNSSRWHTHKPRDKLQFNLDKLICKFPLHLSHHAVMVRICCALPTLFRQALLALFRRSLPGVSLFPVAGVAHVSALPVSPRCPNRLRHPRSPCPHVTCISHPGCHARVARVLTLPASTYLLHSHVHGRPCPRVTLFVSELWVSNTKTKN